MSGVSTSTAGFGWRGRLIEALWTKYIQLTEAEAAFQASKNKLAIRPLFHTCRRFRDELGLNFRAMDIALRLKAIRKTFGSTTAVDDLDLEAARGALYGVIGPNGAGRTTTIRMIMSIVARLKGVADAGLPARVRRALERAELGDTERKRCAACGLSTVVAFAVDTNEGLTWHRR